MYDKLHITFSLFLSHSLSLISLSGSNHVIACCSNGTAFAWGNNSYGQCGLPHDKFQVLPAVIDTFIKENIQVTSVCAGARNSGFLTLDGQLYTTGASISLGIRQIKNSFTPGIDRLYFSISLCRIY